MKVKLITPLHDDSKNQDLWRVDFEEDSKPMWTSFAPSFTVGHTIDDEKLQPSRKGTSWVFKKKSTATATEVPKSASPRTYGKTPEEQASIERQVDKKITGEIYGYHIEKGVPFNKKLLEEIFRAVRGLGALLEEAKKLGAVEVDNAS